MALRPMMNGTGKAMAPSTASELAKAVVTSGCVIGRCDWCQAMTRRSVNVVSGRRQKNEVGGALIVQIRVFKALSSYIKGVWVQLWKCVLVARS